MSNSDQEWHTGVVKWYNPTKGYGFIELHGDDIGNSSNKSNDIFVHISALPQGVTLDENAKVKFQIKVEGGRDGKRTAVNVEVLEL